MIAGMLVALTMVFLFASHLDTLTLARAVAIGFGESINRSLICQPEDDPIVELYPKAEIGWIAVHLLTFSVLELHVLQGI